MKTFPFKNLMLLILLSVTCSSLSAQRDSILIDFGDNLSPAPWNNISSPDTGFIDGLVTTSSDTTLISIHITDDFNNINRAGTENPSPSIGIPATASGDSFFGNVASFGGQEQPTAALQLTNLTVTNSYTISLFASRVATDNREAEYIVKGSTVDTVYLNASSNDSVVVSVETLPDENGTIEVLVAPGPNNDNGSMFYYLGAMIVSYEETQPPVVIDSILIDFGDNLSGGTWNNIVNPDTGFVNGLINTNSMETQFAISVVDDFNNINRAGTENPAPSTGLPPTASGDSFFGNVAPFGGQEQPTGAVALTNLSLSTSYKISIFASRVATDNRETEYIVKGSTIDTVYLNASSNDSVLVNVETFPDENGTIEVLVGPGPNNDNGSQFYYLGAMIVSYEEQEPPLVLETILVDFGNDLSDAPWNNVSDPREGAIDDLLLSSGFTSGRSLAIYDAFNNINTAGTTEPDSSLGIPPTASGDSFFGNVASFGGQEQPTAGVRLSNFEADKPVELNLFASRIASDNRETQYIVTGATVDTVYLNASSNTDQLAVSTVLPKEDGTIDILVSPGPNNNNGSNFYYLGALKIIYDADEVVEAELSLRSPNGGETWQVGKTPRIQWESRNNPSVLVEYSTDGGVNWSEIGSFDGIDQGVEWEVPNEPTEEALVRVSAGDIMDVSDGVFTILDDSTTCNIVILGSSTAEGSGAAPRDSSWVNRFANELTQQNTKFNVINLARGGYNTFNILPTGTEIPDGVSASIDEDRNMTEALSYDPAVIIVNMPSNDAASGYGVEMQLNNFATLYNAGQENGATTFICTTQPRNFTDSERLKIQSDVADSILLIYGDHAIDFWSPLVASDTTILDEYDSGDGVHVNNGGHFELYKQVSAKQIDTIECSSTVGIFEIPGNQLEQVEVYPNPFHDQLQVRFFAKDVGRAHFVMYDNLGRNLGSVQREITSTGMQELTLKNMNELTQSLSVIHLQIILDTKERKSSSIITLLKQ